MYRLLLLLPFLMTNCFNVRECKNARFEKGVFYNKDFTQSRQIPNWNDSLLIFQNELGLKDTFVLEKKEMKMVERKAIQIEVSSRDYFTSGISARQLSTGEKYSYLLTINYMCKTNELSLNVNWGDFWDWAKVLNGMPNERNEVKLITDMKIDGKQLSDLYFIKARDEDFPDAKKTDVASFIWHNSYGVVGYTSRSTGAWTRLWVD